MKKNKFNFNQLCFTFKAQEDVELLKSLVTPLEEEIKALKDKLRATDEQLQKCKQCGHSSESDVCLLHDLSKLCYICIYCTLNFMQMFVVTVQS